MKNDAQRPRLGELRAIAFRPHFAKPYVGRIYSLFDSLVKPVF